MANAKGTPDYYKILGVPRNADAEEIKRAYRRSALENHPDRGGDAQRFKEISEAYEVLSDSERRRQYDRGGQSVAFGAGAAREIAMDVFRRFVRNALREIPTKGDVT